MQTLNVLVCLQMDGLMLFEKEYPSLTNQFFDKTSSTTYHDTGVQTSMSATFVTMTGTNSTETLTLNGAAYADTYFVLGASLALSQYTHLTNVAGVIGAGHYSQLFTGDKHELTMTMDPEESMWGWDSSYVVSATDTSQVEIGTTQTAPSAVF